MSPAPSITVARALGERGEVLLRRRPSDGALELRVNGVFVMDDLETSTERTLARATLAATDSSATGPATPAAAAPHSPAPRPAVAHPVAPANEAWRVVVAGLGLGFTLTEVLADPHVDSVLVVEIEAALVSWHREGLVPGSQLQDRRVEVVVDDVRAVLPRVPAASIDLILLDVDNGPDFLVYDANAAVYESSFLTNCRAVLQPSGRLAIWSSSSSPALTTTLDSVFGSSTELVLPVTLQSRPTTYHVFLAPSR